MSDTPLTDAAMKAALASVEGQKTAADAGTAVARILAQGMADLELRLSDTSLDAARYRWLRSQYARGQETYLAEGISNEDELDKYIDRKM